MRHRGQAHAHNPALFPHRLRDTIRKARGLAMGHARNLSVLAAAIFLSQAAISSTASAGGVCAGLTLSCENGRSYPLCPIAISDEGEMVTGRLGLGPPQRVHVRLVPMGVGYR